MKNLYRPIESVIEDIKRETHNITTYRFRPKEPISFKAGQFVELTVPGVGEAPFTPSSNPNFVWFKPVVTWVFPTQIDR